MSVLHRATTLAVLACAAAALTGCALTGTAPPVPVTQAGAALQGRVHGGQQPVAGAAVYLYAAGSSGYGGASVSLLQASTATVPTPGATTKDGTGNYFVTTDANGFFSISGDYTCTAGQQVYLYALGGNPGSGANTAAAFFAILGNCPGGNFATQTPTIWVNEVSTVVAAYAFAGFATDATHVASSGTAQAKVGIANAFANAANLANLATGVALVTTPGGNGAVPQGPINTLANILASCVNSNAPTSSQCTLLFSNTLSGGTTGSTPTETATAAINIAHNPGVNVATLFNLPPPARAFVPALTAKPGDWTLPITFTGGGLHNPDGLAVDATGNVWAANTQGNSLSEFSPIGTAITGASGYTGGGLSEPTHLAIDTSDNVWATNSGEGTWGYYAITELSSAGAVISPAANGYSCGAYNCSPISIDAFGNAWSASGYYVQKVVPGTGITSYGLFDSQALAIDGSNHIWIAFSNGANNIGLTYALDEWSDAAVNLTTTPYTGGGEFDPIGEAIDGSGNIWLANENSTITLFSSAGVPLSNSPIQLAGIALPSAICIDGANTAWSANNGNNSISRFTSAGVPYPGTPYSSGNLAGDPGMGIDPSGNVWVSNSQYSALVEYIGAAAPTITPIALAVKNNSIGTRP